MSFFLFALSFLLLSFLLLALLLFAFHLMMFHIVVECSFQPERDSVTRKATSNKRKNKRCQVVWGTSQQNVVAQRKKQKVNKAKNITSSKGLLTGFLNRTIDKAPIIPNERAMSSLITDVIIIAILGSNKYVPK